MSGGKFFVVTEHPDHPVVSRVLQKSEGLTWVDEPMRDGSRIQITLYDVRENPVCTFVFRHWNRETVKRAFMDAGFTGMDWCEFGQKLFQALALPERLVEAETRIGLIAW